MFPQPSTAPFGSESPRHQQQQQYIPPFGQSQSFPPGHNGCNPAFWEMGTAYPHSQYGSFPPPPTAPYQQPRNQQQQVHTHGYGYFHFTTPGNLGPMGLPQVIPPAASAFDGELRFSHLELQRRSLLELLEEQQRALARCDVEIALLEEKQRQQERRQEEVDALKLATISLQIKKNRMQEEEQRQRAAAVQSADLSKGGNSASFKVETTRREPTKPQRSLSPGQEDQKPIQLPSESAAVSVPSAMNTPASTVSVSKSHNSNSGGDGGYASDATSCRTAASSQFFPPSSSCSARTDDSLPSSWMTPTTTSGSSSCTIPPNRKLHLPTILEHDPDTAHSADESTLTPNTYKRLGSSQQLIETSNYSTENQHDDSNDDEAGSNSHDDTTNESISVATSTFGEDRQQLIEVEILDPYGDAGIYTGVALRSTGLPHGLGRMVYKDNTGRRMYEGDWRHGRWCGYGRSWFPTGDSYEGEYLLDQRHGNGIYRWADGRVYEGMFVDNKRHGKGKFTWPDGAEYEGEFVNGSREGYGSYSFGDGGRYTGNWKKSRFHGYGTCTWATGNCYHGEWRYGKAHGKGVELYADGSVRHDGQWIDDEPVYDSKDKQKKKGVMRSAHPSDIAAGIPS